MAHTDRGPEVHPTPATTPAGMAAHDTHRQQSNPGTAANRGPFDSTDYDNYSEDIEIYISNAMTSALRLSKIFLYTRHDTATHRKRLDMAVADATYIIAGVQQDILSLCKEVWNLCGEADYLIHPADGMTPAKLLAEVQHLREEMERLKNRREGALILLGFLRTMVQDKLSDDERAALKEKEEDLRYHERL